jgi:hypothetical protein
MSWFGKKRRKESVDLSWIDGDAVADSILHPSSFSLIVFRGNLGGAMEALLTRCDYTILREGDARGDPVELGITLEQTDSPKNVVLKAYWASPQMTVLIDPEMVVASGSDEQLAAFCADFGTPAVAAVWERVSSTAILTEIGTEGITRQTWYEQGHALNAQINPRDELAQSPDQHGLRMAMAAAGVDVDEVFAERDVVVLELRE